MSKTVLITGSSRGIGRSIALRFAKGKYNIVINCVNNHDLLEQLKDEITAMGADCIAFTGDVSDYDTVSRMFDTIKYKFGSVDVLINNAGISQIGLFQDLERKDWNRIIDTNIGSIYNCCHFAIPDMIKNKQGKIINISSVWGICGASCEVAYSASKGAVNALTQALAKELAPSSIQVNAVACGAIDTQMNSFLSKDEADALNEEIPAGRMGSADEVASLVFQIYKSPDYLTGQIIRFDGGWI